MKRSYDTNYRRDDYYSQERGGYQENYDQRPLPQNQMYGPSDKPLVSDKDKRFVVRQLFRLKLQSFVGIVMFGLLFLIASILIAIYVTGEMYSFGFDDSITGEYNLIWMALGAFVGFVFLVIFISRWLLLRKDKARMKTIGQNDLYVPLSLKRYYRAIKSNTTFVHYFAFLGYIGFLLAMLVTYCVSTENPTINPHLALIKTHDAFMNYVYIFSACIGVVFITHFFLVFIRYKKVNLFDAKFGYEIVPMEQIIALRKRNRRICLFITLIILLIGVVVYFVLKRLKPSIPNLLSFKK